MLQERNGTRKFEKLSRWNSIAYTTITDKSVFAPYAESGSNGGAKLWLNYFVVKGQTYPMGRFKKVDTPVMLDDLTQLVKHDAENALWLEVDEVNEKVRLYKEIV